MFTKQTEKEIKNILPKKMKRPFTAKEIKDAIKSLKNGKSAGIDNVYGEMLKYGPDAISSEIAEIFNEISESGQYPSEIKEGILIPLQKPGKKAGTPQNLRPISLLSMLRKVLAICMIRRCLHKILLRIPNTQAAYQPRRSTTELVFSMKVLAEKAIISEDYEACYYYLTCQKPLIQLEEMNYSKY